MKLVPKTEMNEADVDNDYKYQRENFYNLIERGQDAIDGILDLARESEHPRSYEVAGNLIKQVADVTEKLGDLQTKMKKLKEANLYRSELIPVSGKLVERYNKCLKTLPFRECN